MKQAASAGALYVAQSASAYAARMPAVVDCSLVAAWLFNEPNAREALACMEGRELVAPASLNYELANVSMNKVRKGISTAEAARATLAKVDAIEIAYHHVERDAVLAMAIAYQLSAYDAAYLCLAEQLPAPLFTFDKILAAAAKKHFASPSGT